MLKESRMARKQRRQHIHDEGPTQKYFAALPHLVRQLPINVFARDLYWHYKSVTTEEGDLCDQSTRELAEALGVSGSTIAKAKQDLRAVGLITIETIDTPSGPGDAVRCIDIWPHNMAAFGKHPRPRKERIQEQITELKTHAQPPKPPKGVKESVRYTNASPDSGAVVSQEALDLDATERSRKRSPERSRKRSPGERSLKTVNNSLKPVKNPPTPGDAARAEAEGGEPDGVDEPIDQHTVQYLTAPPVVRSWKKFQSLPYALVVETTREVRDNPRLVAYRCQELMDHLAAQATQLPDHAAPPAPAEPSSAPHADHWHRCLDVLRSQLTPSEFTTWFAETTLLDLDDTSAIVGAANVFARERLQTQYRDQIAAALDGRTIEIVIGGAP
jgi:hypothetical protein